MGQINWTGKYALFIYLQLQGLNLGCVRGKLNWTVENWKQQYLTHF